MKLRLVASSLALASVIGLPASVAFAQANPANSGYVIYATGDAKNNIVRSARYGTNNATCNLCVRHSNWTPAMAIEECDPDLVKKAAAPAPAPAPVARPPAPAPAPVAVAPAPAAPAPAPVAPAPAPVAAPVAAPAPVAVAAPQRVTLASKAIFASDKAILKPEGQAVLDREIVSRIREVNSLELVLVTGHADRSEGSQQAAQQLSERRAAAVAAYLASKGVPRDKIETLGMGKTQPSVGTNCTMTNRKALVSCLQPHRRVEVEVRGTR